MSNRVQLNLKSIGKYLDESIHKHIEVLIENFVQPHHEVQVSLNAAYEIGTENLLDSFRKNQMLVTLVPPNDKVETFFEILKKQFFSRRYVMTAERLTWKNYCDLIKETKTLFTEENESALTTIIENYKVNINLNDKNQLYHVWNSFIDIIMNEFITFHSSVYVKLNLDSGRTFNVHIMTIYSKNFGLLADIMKASISSEDRNSNTDDRNTAARNEAEAIYAALLRRISIAIISKTPNTDISIRVNRNATREAIIKLENLVKKIDNFNLRLILASQPGTRKRKLEPENDTL